MLSNASKTHESFFSSAANEVTGSLDKKYSGLRDYFNLKETNRQLAFENAQLRNALKSNFPVLETGKIAVTDSLVKDTLGRFRKYTYLPGQSNWEYRYPAVELPHARKG